MKISALLKRWFAAIDQQATKVDRQGSNPEAAKS
jgi:hypothetical protein